MFRVATLLFYITFGIYGWLLFSVVFIRYPITPEHLYELTLAARNVNYVPFQTITNYLHGTYRVPTFDAWLNVFGNIVMFIPLGIYLQIVVKRKRITALLILSTTILIESVQYVLNIGATDIDDIILNFTGGMLGMYAVAISFKLLGMRPTFYLVTLCSVIVHVLTFLYRQ
ncbi:VanZ family protein [Lysinibacillus sp. BF-4]|uniref:VanZ family protein n=1 Tax=Lysinibacillus sp. BF-4 TaxID=1473546 RepID=UPI00068BD286|nr:VanZ family protein [Lysinibacillus sp. BF-4]